MSNLLEQASLVMIPSGYKEDVVYSEIPLDGSGDLSFTRASNGTRINSAGLVEVCPWNLLEQSETFDNAAWVKNNCSISSNAIIAPNGTTTADKLVEDTSTSIHRISQNQGSINGVFYAYAKAGERTKVAINTSPIDVGFDLSNGTLINLGYGTTGASIESVGNGWWRISLYLGVANSTYYLGLLDASNNQNYTGDGTSGAYFWGAQLNIGSTAKPYFPTTDRLNVPRLTYQNGGGGCPSLLLEKQSTNLQLYSEDFRNIAEGGATNTWTPNDTLILSTNNTAPDGTLTATRIRGNGSNRARQAVIFGTSGAPYSGSIFIRRVSGTANIELRVGDVSQVSTINPTSDWQRFAHTASPTSTAIRLAVVFSNNTDEFEIWGAQLEASSYATSYIPTTSSSATRVADLSANDVFGSTYTLDADFCLFQDFECFDFGNGQVFWSGGNYGTSGDYRSYMIAYSTGNIVLFGVNEVATAQLSAFIFSTNTRYKVAVRRVGSTINWFVNGTKYSNASGTTTTTVKIRSISGASLGGQSTMKLNEAIIFEDKTLTDDDCISLTTI